jgi:hypothetical protein
LLLPGARTAHSRFKIPFELVRTSSCKINLQTDDAKLIQRASLILWDECPMMHRFAFEALDRSLKDIMGRINPRNRDLPFGGKIIVFGGDFRQILPVCKRGSQNDIVQASFNRSELWRSVKILELTINMRILSLSGEEQLEAQTFADWLLRIGEGKEPTFRNEITCFNDYIKLPESIARKMTERELIDLTFPDLKTNQSDVTSRVITACTNKKADEINNIATDVMPGEAIELLSIDSTIKDSQQANYPTEFLNTLSVSGLPPHKLRVKIGLPIIMLRNLNPNAGLCNGTRLVVKTLHTKFIEATIAIGIIKYT